MCERCTFVAFLRYVYLWCFAVGDVLFCAMWWGQGVCFVCERCTFVAFLQYVHLCFFAVGDVLFWCDVVGSGGILFCVRDVLLWCGVMVDGCVRS